MGEITNDWAEPLSEEYKKPYYKELYDKVKEEYSNYQVFPDSEDIFNAFHYTPLHNVKQGVTVPPSLCNIYKELKSDLGCYIPNNGYLKKWADQGVMLLNTALTVRAHEANSHKDIGWEKFTDAAIRILNEQDRPIVYLLWGRFAQMKKKMLNNPKHLILEAAHPSPLSVKKFYGCKHFSKANEFLKEHGLEPIDWQIENI